MYNATDTHPATIVNEVIRGKKDYAALAGEASVRGEAARLTLIKRSNDDTYRTNPRKNFATVIFEFHDQDLKTNEKIFTWESEIVKALPGPEGAPTHAERRAFASAINTAIYRDKGAFSNIPYIREVDITLDVLMRYTRQLMTLKSITVFTEKNACTHASVGCQDVLNSLSMQLKALNPRIRLEVYHVSDTGADWELARQLKEANAVRNEFQGDILGRRKRVDKRSAMPEGLQPEPIVKRSQAEMEAQLSVHQPQEETKRNADEIQDSNREESSEGHEINVHYYDPDALYAARVQETLYREEASEQEASSGDEINYDVDESGSGNESDPSALREEKEHDDALYAARLQENLYREGYPDQGIAGRKRNQKFNSSSGSSFRSGGSPSSSSNSSSSSGMGDISSSSSSHDASLSSRGAPSSSSNSSSSSGMGDISSSSSSRDASLSSRGAPSSSSNSSSSSGMGDISSSSSSRDASFSRPDSSFLPRANREAIPKRRGKMESALTPPRAANPETSDEERIQSTRLTQERRGESQSSKMSTRKERENSKAVLSSEEQTPKASHSGSQQSPHLPLTRVPPASRPLPPPTHSDSNKGVFFSSRQTPKARHSGPQQRPRLSLTRVPSHPPPLPPFPPESPTHSDSNKGVFFSSRQPPKAGHSGPQQQPRLSLTRVPARPLPTGQNEGEESPTSLPNPNKDIVGPPKKTGPKR